MTIKFMEPGGDANFTVTGAITDFWGVSGTVSVATDIVRAGHQKSLQYAVNSVSEVFFSGLLSDTGSRINFGIYINALPSATATVLAVTDVSSNIVVRLRITSAGVLQLWGASGQIGSSGSTIAVGKWYRFTLAYTVGSTTVNRFEFFKDGVSDISVTNATIDNTASDTVIIGNASGNLTLDIRTSDHYIDDSASLTDTGDIWVTNKRPFSNGSLNNFNVQIGSGASGYGSGHAQQINERPYSATNGWSVVGAGSPITEQYIIEAANVGDMDVSRSRIVGYQGWVVISSVITQTVTMVVGVAQGTVSAVASPGLFFGTFQTSVYPARTIGDIGLITGTTITTVSLYECGMMIAFIPPPINAPGNIGRHVSVGDGLGRSDLAS